VPADIDGNMLVSAALLAAIYVVIFSDIMHRANAALIGAVLMVITGMALGFYTQEAAVLAIDVNTLLLLFGMMVVVTVLRPTGVFEFAAIRITHLARGSPVRLLVYLGFAVSVISMFLDNVTTIIIFAPVTVLITRIMNLNPMPYLVSEAMLSNIGGAATLVGDPPNIMIGSASGLGFVDFIAHLGPPIAVIWIISTSLLVILFRRRLRLDSEDHHVDLDERRAIRDAPRLRIALLGLGVIIFLFFVHHPLGLYPSFATLIGLALILVLARPDPEVLLREVHWSLLVFFAGLFVIVGGVEGSGLLALLGSRLAAIATDPAQLLAAAIILMWSAALLSSIVDNIPFTVTMIPIMQSLESQGVNVMPLWWALAIGVGVGGNGTHLGATASVVAVAELDDCGIPEARVSPIQWVRFGLPTTTVGLSVATVLFVAFFDFFS